MRKSFQKAIAAVMAAAFAMTLAAGVAPSTAQAITKEAKKAAKAAYDPAGTYHAYFGLQQTETWIFRDPWYSDTLGIGGTSLKEAGLEFENNLLQSGDDGTKAIEGATVTDAEITGNGVYTVGVEGLNGVLRANTEAVLAMIYVDTDIPVTAKDEGFTISDVKLQLDGMDQTLPEEIFFNFEEELANKLVRFDPVNTYQRDQGGYPDCPSVVAPTDSIKITFTVSGMTNDNPDAVEATPEPTKAADAQDSDSGDAADSGSSGEDESSGVSAPVVVGIVVVVAAVIGCVVIVTKKKK